MRVHTLLLIGTLFARGPDPNVVFPADADASPAVKYAALDLMGCEAELTTRGVPFRSVVSAVGVVAPVRLTGPIRGVTFHSAIPTSQQATSPYEIIDCRLALALDDFAIILAKYDVVEVVHLSVYRPPPSAWPPARVGGQHDGALAIDCGTFIRKDGTKLVVERDFHGKIGRKTCGPNTGPQPPSQDSLTLRKIFCDTADARLFNVELTPDYNWAHRNHFHLEVTARVKWFLVR